MSARRIVSSPWSTWRTMPPSRATTPGSDVQMLNRYHGRPTTEWVMPKNSEATEISNGLMPGTTTATTWRRLGRWLEWRTSH